MPGNIQNDGDLDKADPREILDLRVKEISAVDRDAIQVGFLVVKRQQEDSMGAFDGDSNDAIVDEIVEKMDWREYADVTKALPADLLGSITKAVAWMKKTAKADDAPTEDLGRVAAFLSKVAAGKFPDPKEASKDGGGKSDVDKQEKCPECKAALKEGACTKCDFKVKAKADDDDADADGKDKKDKDGKVTKSEEGMTVTVTPSGEIQISGQPVNKGLKGFTSDRTETLKTTVKGLLGMLAEVDVEATKAIVEELLKAQLPSDFKWSSGTNAMDAAGVKKMLSEVVEEVVTPLKKGLEDHGGKVTEISKTRGSPTSDGGDDSTDKTDVNKGDGNGENFWANVPIAKS